MIEGTNQIVASIYLGEARSKYNFGLRKWLSYLFVPPFLILEQFLYCIRSDKLCQDLPIVHLLSKAQPFNIQICRQQGSAYSAGTEAEGTDA